MAMKLKQIGEEPLCRREFLQQCAGGAVALGLVFGLPRDVAARQLPIRWLGAGEARMDGSEVSYPLPAEDGVSVDRDNELILVRETGAVYAFALSCPHQRSLLKWREKDHQFRCTKHGSRYEPTGKYVSGRATRGMDRYAVRIEGTQVIVDMSQKFLEDEDPAGWDAAMAKVGGRP